MSAELWKSILDVIPDVERWNRNLPRLVAEYGQEFKRFAQAEAAKRELVTIQEGSLALDGRLAS